MTFNSLENKQETRSDHDNYLGVVRFALAVLVIYSHSYPLSGEFHEPIDRLTHGANNIGSIAVDTFFIISGYLITQSWINSSSSEQFAIKRIARIYPGYWIAFAFSLIIGTVFSRPNTIDYIKHVLPHRDAILTALIFLTYGALDSNFAFQHNPCPHEVNGSLWTLQPELVCYLSVFVLGSFKVLRRNWLVLAIFAILLFGATFNVALYGSSNFSAFWRLLSVFLGGSIFYLYKDMIPKANPLLIIAALGIISLCFMKPIFYPLFYPLFGSYLIFSFAFTKPPILLRWRTDLSYGVYIYGYPIQQACVAFFHLPKSPALLLMVTMPFVLCCAWLSWHYVEHPAIKYFRRKY